MENNETVTGHIFETQYNLFDCYRIALDFGPAAAQRAVEQVNSQIVHSPLSLNDQY